MTDLNKSAWVKSRWCADFGRFLSELARWCG